MKVPGGPHFWISIVKSIIRIGGCIVGVVAADATGALTPANLATPFIVVCASLLVAELIGIAEEIFDSRD